MKIYVAFIQENNWETELENIGCYSTEEKSQRGYC